MIAGSARRVIDHTSEEVNQKIHSETEDRLEFFRDHREEIPQRLRELDAEWDIERVLETGSSTLTLTGLLLGMGVNRKWLF